MIKIPSRSALHQVPKLVPPAPVPEVKPAVSDVVNAALESLADSTRAAFLMIEHFAKAQQQTSKQLVDLAAERKPPIRLEAEIIKDKNGKMTNVVIRPIHK